MRLPATALMCARACRDPPCCCKLSRRACRWICRWAGNWICRRFFAVRRARPGAREAIQGPGSAWRIRGSSDPPSGDQLLTQLPGRASGGPYGLTKLWRKWCRRRDSNPRPTHYECAALPTELLRLPGASLPQMTPVCKPHAAANHNPCASHTLHKPRAAPDGRIATSWARPRHAPGAPCVGAESRPRASWPAPHGGGPDAVLRREKIRRRHAPSRAPLPKAPICCLIVAAAA